MKMPHLVTQASQSVDAIKKFQSELDASTILQDRLGYARSWYFTQIGDDYIYAPSKWIGYVGMTADVYVGISKEIDGKKTEAVLKQWYDVISVNSRIHSLHLNNLKKFLSQYDKSPSSAVRFNLLTIDLDDDKSFDSTSKLLDLIAHVVSELSAEDQLRLKKKIFL
jgi:hypothetical protein